MPQALKSGSKSNKTSYLVTLDISTGFFVKCVGKHRHYYLGASFSAKLREKYHLDIESLRKNSWRSQDKDFFDVLSTMSVWLTVWDTYRSYLEIDCSLTWPTCLCLLYYSSVTVSKHRKWHDGTVCKSNVMVHLVNNCKFANAI